MLALLPIRLARANEVVIEIDAAAENLIDARATRRLVSIELRDIDVLAGRAGTSPLFFRVLGRPPQQLRVELWERGELHDVRLVSGSEGAGHLLARRVALAAAELARHLRQKHLLLRRQQQRELEQLRRLGALAAFKTREGPLALRAEYQFAWNPKFWSVGPALTGELSLRRSLRLDLGVRQQLGTESAGRSRLGWYEVAVGPAVRLHPARRWDVDVAADVAAALVNFTRALSVDEIANERTTWSARAGLSVRVQSRLTRGARASLGVSGGLLLRPISAMFERENARYSGGYAGIALGVVLTPQ